MKKYFSLLALLLLLGSNACQSPFVQVAHAVDVAPVAPVVMAAKAVLSADSSLRKPNEEAQTFLNKYDVGSLLIRPDGPLQGFTGADHYRTELFLTKVVRDTSTVNLYRVRGKSRSKKNVLTVTGYLILNQVQEQPQLTKKEQARLKSHASYPNHPNAYSVLGHFRLQEDSLARGAGRYEGQVVIDFVIDKSGQLSIETQSPHTASQDAGIKLEGTWTSYSARQQKPVVWAYYIWFYGESVLENFNVGERGPEVNPKYAKLGWGDFWENSEWWAEPGTATAQVSVDSL